MTTPANAPKGKLVRTYLSLNASNNWLHTCILPHPLGSRSPLTDELDDDRLDALVLGMLDSPAISLRTVVQARSNEGLRIAVATFEVDAAVLEMSGAPPTLIHDWTCSVWEREAELLDAAMALDLRTKRPIWQTTPEPERQTLDLRTKRPIWQTTSEPERQTCWEDLAGSNIDNTWETWVGQQSPEAFMSAGMQDSPLEAVEAYLAGDPVKGWIHDACYTAEDVADLRSALTMHISNNVRLVETMPESLRRSHLAVGNRGHYPFNGAVRHWMSTDDANEACDADPEWTSIVELGLASYQ